MIKIGAGLAGGTRNRMPVVNSERICLDRRRDEVTTLQSGPTTPWEAMISAIDHISEHFICAEKLRRLRQQPMETIDHSRREEILTQTEEIAEDLKNKYKA